VVFAWLLFCMWIVMPSGAILAQAAALAGMVIFVVFSQFLHNETWRTMGLDLRWFVPSLWRIGTFAVPAIGGMWLAGRIAGSIKFSARAYVVVAAFYFFWALAQQYLFQSFLARRLRICGGGRVGVAAVVGVMFAIIHLPAPCLAGASLIFGFVAAFAFYERPNLYAVALAQGALGAAFYGFLPSSLTGIIEGGQGLLRIPFDILQQICRL